MKKIAIVGSGPAGSTIARLAADMGIQVDLYEQRNHIAGNCFDQLDPHGQLIHTYGPHYFRTDSQELLNWLSHYTEWHTADYFVKAVIGSKEFPLPISLSTFEKLKESQGKKITDFEQYLASERVQFQGSPQNAMEQCLMTVGKEFYELFFKNYTLKQWGVLPEKLAASVTARIPLRFNYDERYPSEKFQQLPLHGYNALFKRLLAHPLIELRLKEEMDFSKWKALRKSKNYQALVYTGPLDYFFNYQFGKLTYRSLRFEFKNYQGLNLKQSCVQLNYPNHQEFTRSVEIKHLLPKELRNNQSTTVSYEYPAANGEPYYPMPLKSEEEKFNRYQEFVKTLGAAGNNEVQDQIGKVLFIGRLAEYRYYNMDHIFLKALKVGKEFLEKI